MVRRWLSSLLKHNLNVTDKDNVKREKVLEKNNYVYIYYKCICLGIKLRREREREREIKRKREIYI